MTRRFDKLVTLLKELFQLDQPDLDFGIYRVMHAKSAEVTHFLEMDLLPQVRAAFAQYQPADKAAIEKELTDLRTAIEKAGMDPAQSPKVEELERRLAEDAVDLDALEAEVYDRLYGFFRRYYSEGDFLSKRVYKPGVYAIPYEGEEVKLHWANADQYYIKTSEYLRDYAFRLRPADDRNPMRVHFRLVDAAEGEHGNVKEAVGKERRFKLAPGTPVVVEDGELVIRFIYEPDPAKQKELNAATEQTILGLADPLLMEWLRELGRKHVRSDGAESDATRLRVHLDRYTARNTFDYFIHKDLSGFLRRELDFYIKNEVMHLDDVESETAPRVEQYLSKIKVIRRIAGKIIEFLAQLEGFQKKLWLKKKFVVETSWCIRVGCIPEEFYPEIAANEAQREEWVKLFAIDEIESDLTTPAYSEPITAEFLKAHPTLALDTRHFEAGFTARLIELLGDLEKQIDGVLIHSENFQALALMQTQYREQVRCVYIDPPYNSGSDGFVYKDSYQHSSWATMMSDRLCLAEHILCDDGIFFASIDDNEHAILRILVDDVFGLDAHLPAAYWEKVYSSRMDAKTLSEDHDNIVIAGRGVSRIPFEQNVAQFNCIDAQTGRSYRPRSLRKEGSNSRRSDRPNLYYAIEAPDGSQLWPIRPDGAEGCWRWAPKRYAEKQAAGTVEWVHSDGRWQVFVKQYLSEEPTKPPSTLWRHDEAGHNHEATELIKDLFGIKAFSSPKPPRLIQFMCSVAGVGPQDIVLDYFAGSGTTGHAVINLNREDGGRRKVILVEMSDYFDTVLVPRLKKVTYSPEWEGGKPKRLASPEEAERSPRIMKVVRLESYEDTLNNLELRRTVEQQGLLDLAPAQGEDRLREHYLLGYMLDIETRGSRSLLSVSGFTDPTAYRLKVKRPGSDETREVNVDLLETFNWLIGLTVQHIAAPQTFSAEFNRDGEGRLRLEGRLKQAANGPWWFRTVTGTMPDGRRTLVIWRKRPGGEAPEGLEQDNLVLDEWFQKQGYSSKDSEFGLIYVNGDNNLENLKTPDDTWKVRLIEENFHRLMFEMNGV